MRGFSLYSTKWGNGAVISDDSGLIGVTFPHKREVHLEQEVAGRFGRCQHLKDASRDLCSSLGLYFSGEKIEFSDVRPGFGQLTEFERTVYECLRRVPYGETVTYKELAERCGRPKAARAVGNVLAKNPMPIIVPCHRVVKSDGSIGGWSGKPGWKERLLKIEGVIPR